MALALFDLDRTLIDCNSGRLWVALEWREGNLSIWEAARGFGWLLRYSLGDHDMRHAFEGAVARLEGQSEAEIERRTADWFNDEVAHRIRPGARRALDWHRERGDRLVIATTSSPYAARSARRAFALDDYVSSEFEVREGLFTGRVSRSCLGEGKAVAVAQYAQQLGQSLEDAWFYTDSVSDRALLERVGHPVVVHPDRKLAVLAVEQGWPVEDWGVSR